MTKRANRDIPADVRRCKVGKRWASADPPRLTVPAHSYPAHSYNDLAFDRPRRYGGQLGRRQAILSDGAPPGGLVWAMGRDSERATTRPTGDASHFLHLPRFSCWADYKFYH